MTFTFAEFGARPIGFLLNRPMLVKLKAREATGHYNNGVSRLTNCQKRLDLSDSLDPAQCGASLLLESAAIVS
jgi:hypothetical protein